MKKYWALIGLLSFVVLALYFVQFNVVEIPAFSSKQSEWANFGSYIGGTLGPVFAFLAYLGIREQLAEQKRAIDLQSVQRAFDTNIASIKETFERFNLQSASSVEPIEKYLNVSLNTSVKSELSKALRNSDTFDILDDIIDACRLLQGAGFVYKSYLFLIDESSASLKVDCPLDEHKWVAITTWRTFEKRALFLYLLAKKAKTEVTEPNQEMFEREHRELLIYITAYEGWEKSWESIGVGF
ncbi:hypothetical protein A1OO_17205 [Enterovibrio norvegicus FF-33]|uniref:hypothetical protein n=1 Tax=Enterovibrio norvegicus TaxID=188144 RepID=UPI0003103697|nr:hypothetical protein [Enterovibrio norvegicus]OEE67484.1 hypothetical protein A1OO_17205 [Enterovibrio norvegicus FF-33]OEE83345.1 hypothetical protein A1OQ_19155 [Enterovibrio norvegicus FF-162]